MKLFNTKTKYSKEAIEFLIVHIGQSLGSISGVSFKNIEYGSDYSYIDILFSMSCYDDNVKNTFIRTMYALEKELDRKLTLTADNMYSLHTGKIIYGVRIHL